MTWAWFEYERASHYENCDVQQNSIELFTSWEGMNRLELATIFLHSLLLGLGRRSTCFVAYRKLIFSPLSEKSSHYEIFDLQQNFAVRISLSNSRKFWFEIRFLSSLSSITSPTFGLFKFDIYMIWELILDSWLKAIELGFKWPKTWLLVSRSCLSWPLILSSHYFQDCKELCAGLTVNPADYLLVN